MEAFRHFLRGNPAAAALLVLIALAVRLIVPVGFMPGTTAGGVAIMPCPAAGPVPAVMPAMAGMHHGHDAPTKAEPECPFAGLALPALGGADAIQLAALVFVILAAGLSPAVVRPWGRIARLRPPLRGPPAVG